MQARLPQIFAFASNEWHTPWWMARQHLFTRLAQRGWPVVYSTGPQSLWERDGEKWRRGGALHGFDRVAAGDGAPLLVDRPGKLLPLWREEGAWNSQARARHARHLLQVAPARDVRRIAYIWNPRFWPYAKLLTADHVVFHIHDAWNAQAWSDHMKRRHAALVQRADIIITTADNMSRKLPGIGPGGARILPHGVDFDAVEAGARQLCPPDLAAIPRPRIGYTGRVNLKLDFPLIAAAAARRPELQWVFIGATGIGTTYSFDARPDVKAEWEQLNSLGNVHFLGVKDRSEIPAYLHGCDVLSLPFNTSFVGFPTKLYEYLASGKPVVSWNGENIRPLAHLIAPADGVDAWLEALDRALDGRGPGSPEARKAVARAQDWDARADQLEGWLREMTAERSCEAAD